MNTLIEYYNENDYTQKCSVFHMYMAKRTIMQIIPSHYYSTRLQMKKLRTQYVTKAKNNLVRVRFIRIYSFMQKRITEEQKDITEAMYAFVDKALNHVNIYIEQMILSADIYQHLVTGRCKSEILFSEGTVFFKRLDRDALCVTL